MSARADIHGFFLSADLAAMRHAMPIGLAPAPPHQPAGRMVAASAFYNQRNLPPSMRPGA